MNAKMGNNNYFLELHDVQRTMVVGVDVCNAPGSGKFFLGLVSSYNSALSQYSSQVELLSLPSDFMGGKATLQEQCKGRCDQRADAMVRMMKAAMVKYREHNGGKLPDKIHIFRDGVGGPQMLQGVVNREVADVIDACCQFGGEKYTP